MLARVFVLGVAMLALPALGGAMVWGCQATCTSSGDCATGQFCRMQEGACQSAQPLGFCNAMPETNACSQAGPVVCGCNGTTYLSECDAALHGQSVAGNGACPAKPCGGLLGGCPKDHFCRQAEGNCGLTDAPGTCTPVPTVDACDAFANDPVCGCKGKTFPSRCAADAAGESVAVAGGCPCGTAGATTCQAGEYCNFALGTCGGIGAAGTCAPVPPSCPPFSDPVCGCDFKTYDSACDAAMAQVGMLAAGGCPCGGPNGTQCGADQFCDYGTPGTCLLPNANGVCAPKPTSCVPPEADVCGCDNHAYLNACEAAKAGTSVAYTGACGAGGGMP